jgi:hypothetical protein
MEVNTTSTAEPLNMYNYINNFVLNPIVFIIVILIIIAYLILFSSLGNNNEQVISEGNGGNFYGQSFLGVLVVVILVILLLINGLQYFFDINVSAYLKNLFTNEPIIDIVVKEDSKHGNENHNEDDDKQKSFAEILHDNKFKKQVFNIPGNQYTYEDAKALCNAYDADLATYQQVESAYKDGGEWCNYGWSDGQMALFPTQQNTFDNLQKIKGHEHDCGRPGVNGGYIANPKIKFGVNCYGVKPKIRQDEEELMKVASPYPKTLQEIEFQRKIDYWKNKINEILISPFNHSVWGQA